MRLGISKTFVKRSIKCLSMFAPLAYLFGSLFFGLNGSHGATVFAEDSQDTQVFNIPLESGYAINENTGFVESSTSAYYSTFAYFSVFVGNHYDYVVPSSSSIRFFKYDSAYSYLGSFVTPSFDGFDGYVRCHVYSPDNVLTSICVSLSGSLVPASVNASSYSDYIFGQFFAKDNFLMKWGENAISDNPKGFAPFGTFLKYIDGNMLHLSDSQIGLMAYGYIYYCAHVLLAFLAFDCIAFIPKLIESVVSKFNGGMKDD